MPADTALPLMRDTAQYACANVRRSVAPSKKVGLTGLNACQGKRVRGEVWGGIPPTPHLRRCWVARG